MQAYIGTTKHMGGLEATKELIALCRIDRGKHVLDVGCGAGATPIYLARKLGCNVVGVDLAEGMIARSNERAMREGVADKVEFKVADAQGLPFENDLFDVVIAESVTTFIKDKRKAIAEYVRVTKPGGYVGLNEETWLKAPPPQLAEYASLTWGGAKPEALDDWIELLRDAGLKDIVAEPHKMAALREASQIWRYGLLDLLRMAYRSAYLYVKSSKFRGYVRDRLPAPGDLFEFLGYAILVGKK